MIDFKVKEASGKVVGFVRLEDDAVEVIESSGTPVRLIPAFSGHPGDLAEFFLLIEPAHPVPTDEFAPHVAWSADGSRVMAVACTRCGAALILHPTIDVKALHRDWHARVVDATELLA